MSTLPFDPDAHAGAFPTGAAMAAFNRQYLETPARLWDAFSVAACAGCGAQAAGVVLDAAHHRRGQAGPPDALGDGDVTFLSERLRRTPGLVAWTPTGARRHYAASAIDDDPDIGFLWIARTGDGLAEQAFVTLRALCGFATLLYRLDMARGEAELLLNEHRHRCGTDLQLVGNLLSQQARRAGDARLYAAMEGAAMRVRALARVRCAAVGGFPDMLHACVAALHAQVDEHRIAMRLVLEGEPPVLDERRTTIALMAVNELVTNALTHAFPDEAHGSVTVHLQSCAGVIRIGVLDDGAALPAGIPPIRAGSGLDLISRLLAGVRGRLLMPPPARADDPPPDHCIKTFTIELPQQ
ncbi:MAG: hypothetical protein DI544_14060 [Sphingomonas taxi]|uniref:histidine kinase n=1 Tax=Sphingomonas taxi TaxID=1549858 RepID=A0A2W5P1T2_9SPHN|nr:MAG: hypothetical protein DI544_14060 [Sphingomonas taxi]